MASSNRPSPERSSILACTSGGGEMALITMSSSSRPYLAKSSAMRALVAMPISSYSEARSSRVLRFSPSTSVSRATTMLRMKSLTPSVENTPWVPTILLMKSWGSEIL